MQVTLDFKLELPQVAVIGSQSGGKSSVLEALVRHCSADVLYYIQSCTCFVLSGQLWLAGLLLSACLQFPECCLTCR